MITLDTLKAKFGAEGEKLFEYLENKHKGGANNAKGGSFETYFTIYQIAKIFNEEKKEAECLFSAQVLGFVDDLEIGFPARNEFRYYQIKDIIALSWEAGDHPLRNDFEVQYTMMHDAGVSGKLFIVVSRQDVWDALKKSHPDSIQEYSEVLHFQTAVSLNRLIQEYAVFKNELAGMCALKNPSTDKLEALGAVLLGVWDASDKTNIDLKGLISRCRELTPNYIKGEANVLSGKITGILGSIDGFFFVLEGGFLRWNYRDTDEGVLAYSIGSQRFEQWENDIFNANIKTFEDLESFLSA